MKKFFFGNKNEDNSPWRPWGFSGWLGRVLLFFILLMVLLIMLSLFRKCSKEQDDDSQTAENAITELPDDIVAPPVDNPVPLPDDIGDFPGRMDNPGPFLPDDDSNLIRQIDEDDIVTDDDSQQLIAGNVLNVILDSGADDETFKKFAQEFKTIYPDDEYKITYYDTLTKLMQISVPTEKREQVRRELPEKINDISFKVFEEAMFNSCDTAGNRPNDKVFSHPDLSWFYAPIQAYEAWNITMGSPNITIAIIDSYFDLNHADLNSNRIVKPYSVRFQNSNVAPANDCPVEVYNEKAGGMILNPAFYHGSMVASQAIGTANNTAPMCGIAPKCKFMPISMGHQFGSMTILQGLLYAIYQGANVVNISAGSVFPEDADKTPIDIQIEEAEKGKDAEDVWDYVFDMADKRNITIVWASGNFNVYAAMDASKRGKSTLRVDAIGRNLRAADFTNFSNIPERNIQESTISAPGVDILGAMPYNKYNVGPGTSFAAPIVAGAVGLMKSINPNLSNTQIINILNRTGKPAAGNRRIGPILQIKDALEMAKNTVPAHRRR